MTATTGHSRRGAAAAWWLILIGLLVLAGGVAALISTGNEEVVNWLKDNSTCNERPCTYSEAKGILTGVGVVASLAGSVLTIFGLWRALRGSDAAPTLSVPPTAAGEGEPEGGYRLRDAEAASSPMDRLARLDILLAEGRLDREQYAKLRERILREI